MKKIYVLIFAASFAGCKSKKEIVEPDTTEISETMDESLDLLNEEEETEELVVTPTRPVYQATDSKINDLLHTHLKVSFDWEKTRLNGEAFLDFTPYFYATDSLILDAKGMDIHKVQLSRGKVLTDLDYVYKNDFIRIKLNKTYKRGEEYRVYIKYTAKPNEFEVGGSSAISGDKGLYFINADSSAPCKPTQAWTQGETEASSRWFPTIDSPNEKCTQEIEITVTDKFVSLSNGLLIKSKKNADGTRTDHWKQSKPHAPYLAMMAVGDFAIVKDTWTRKNGKKMEVSYYVEPQFKDYADDIFGETPAMIEFFSNKLGVEYPWEKYSQVIVRDFVSGAMENTTATIHGEFVYHNDRELADGNEQSIIAHELFHHWFGDLATCESWANLPLNESFANYSQFLWDEHRWGEMEADYNANKEAETYIYVANLQGHVDMIRYDYDNKEEMFDANSYNKGGRILNMLRNYVGDEAFFLALQKYLTDNAYKNTEIDHLRLAFEEVTGEDLHWFFNQWFLATGHPVLSFEKEYDDSLKQLNLYISQKQDFDIAPVYKLPMTVDVYHDGKKQRHNVVVDEVNEFISIPMDVAPDLVLFDGERVILSEREEDKTEEEMIHQFYWSDEYLDVKEALAYCSKKRSEESMKVVIDALSHDFYRIRVQAINSLRKVMRKKDEELKPKMIELATKDKWAAVRSTAIRVMERYYETDEQLLALYKNATKDKSYNVVIAGLQAYHEVKPKEGYALAKELENGANASLLTAIADIYAEKASPADQKFYHKNYCNVTGFEVTGFVKAYARFLKNIDDMKITEEGMKMFQDVAKYSGNGFVKYFAGYQALLDIRERYNDKAKNVEKEIAKLEMVENPDQDKISTLSQEKASYIAMAQKAQAMIDDAKKDESDDQVLMLIEGEARMDFEADVDEEE